MQFCKKNLVDSSPSVLANEFSPFFHEKIVKIRSAMDVPSALVVVPTEAYWGSLSTFVRFTPTEVIELVKKCTSKSCSLDPIPTHVLKPIVHVMASSLARLINLSFKTSTFPDSLKLAIITPLFKKSNLDPEYLSNFRTVSGLPFVSKLIEKAALMRLSSYLESSNLLVPFQSTYCSNHSTETEHEDNKQLFLPTTGCGSGRGHKCQHRLFPSLKSSMWDHTMRSYEKLQYGGARGV